MRLNLLDETRAKEDLRKLKILSYNVWFAENIEPRIRMRAIGDIIQLHSPDVICLQEVTPNIYAIFQRANWWKSYKCSLSFDKAMTRRYFCMQVQLTVVYQLLMTVTIRSSTRIHDLGYADEMAKLFPKLFGQPSASLKARGLPPEASLKIGVILSGGQVPGGRNVISGIFGEKIVNFNMTKDSTMYGFRGGPTGVMKGKYVKLTDEFVYPYRNQGGFDIICSGRDKIETPGQFKEAQETVKRLDLDGLVLSKLPVKSFGCKQFSYSGMGRELCIAEVSTQGGIPLVVATSHLESPCPGPPTWDQMYSKERVKQANEALDFLKKNPNAIFCGDMNWDDKLDDETRAKEDLRKLKILSYNVWFAENIEPRIRMRAIGDIIQLHSPDVICLQEVTPNIYAIFQRANWWKSYKCSLSFDKAMTRRYFCMQLSKLPVKSFGCKQFSYSGMGRELCIAEVSTQGGIPLVVATSHLESPCPGPPTWDQMYSKERVKQANEALDFLKKNPNAIFCGDMNWDDKLDGEFPLPDGWFDAWTALKPKEIGWTYDTKANPMLSANWKLQKRLDRFSVSLRDLKVESINMVGTERIPGVTYVKQRKGKPDLELPVLPSDHFGLLLTMAER
ncbi:endonuclease/exonuclease/phosphatase family protein [Artemisia annua]|uniref:Endonuclease/exonuclease/phosphatase family protein n=1 Tax=Artemisia annua TaxID=35608 RepID=A0A2U1QEH6_ARTAN|nr:endonuclease/exonuclease/phosphatase family protein [Artemisia annua]